MLHEHGETKRPIDGAGLGGTRVDMDRFEALTLPHIDAVFRLGRALAGTQQDAEDLVQETYVRAFQAFGKFELREYGAKPWLFRILYNTFYTHRTKRRREPALLGDGELDFLGDRSNRPSLPESLPGHVDWEQFDEEVKLAVDRLQPEYRSALLLWSIEGLTYREIAEVCDCALGTVMSRLYRARRLLASSLADYARDRKWPLERFEA